MTLKPIARGFTLLEILIALAVLSIALAAIIQGVGAATGNAGYLRDRTFAHWVAMNRIAEVQVLKQWPSKGTERGEEEMGNHEWHWQMVVTDAGIDNVRQLQVEVRRERKDEQALVFLVALIGKP